MSYEIIKNISINHKTKEVFLTSCCNNVYPHTPTKWHCTSLTELYKAKGLEILEKEILSNFINGNFQKGTSDYLKSLILYGYNEEGAYSNLLLYRVEKTVKVKIKLGADNFINKITPRRFFYSEEIDKAKIFTLAEYGIIKNRLKNYDLTMITI